jgi:multiple sugar transport system permease protein
MKQHRFEGYLYISPWLAGFFFFMAFPVLYSLYLSFCHWEMISPQIRFVGLKNYQQIFFSDPRFWQSLKVTFIFVLCSVPLGIIGSIVVALILNQDVRGIRIFRTIFFLPAVLSGVAFSFLWINVFNPEFGILNSLLAPLYHFLGLSLDELPRWIYGQRTALASIIIMGLWGIGPGMITYLAALQSIPREFYEAADLDGAGPLRAFRHITLPMLSPVILFNLIMGIIGSFQVFTQGYMMTGGGPQDATLFYVLYIWEKAFRDFLVGYASALAWILFAIILGMTLLTLRVTRPFIFYSGE